MSGELVVYRDGHVETSRGCPDHLTIGALERCHRCMSVFWEQLDRLRRLDAAGEVPPIPRGAP